MGVVLVYQIGSLGDTIVSIPAYRAVRRHYKGHEVKLLEAQLEPGRVHPSEMLVREHLIDGTIRYRHKVGGGGQLGLLKMWMAVFKTHPDFLIYIAPPERASNYVRRDRWFFRSCGVKNLIGFHDVHHDQLKKRDENGFLLRMPHQAEMRLDRLAKDGVSVHAEDLETPLFHITPEERETALDWILARRKHPGRKLLMIGVGSAQQATKWPIDRFQELGERVIRSGLAEIVVVGGPGETAIGQELVTAWGEGIVAAGQFDVHSMAALLTHADLFIGLDTGTTHLAATVDTPILGIYSAHHPPGEWYPLGKGHTILTHNVPCAGCGLRQCNVAGLPCMTGITVDEVWEAVQSRLG